MATTSIIYHKNGIEAVQPVGVADIVKQIKERGSKFLRPFGSKRPEVERFTLHSALFTFPGIYRRQLKMYRRMAQFIDRHTVLSNLWIGGWSVAIVLYIFLYY